MRAVLDGAKILSSEQLHQELKRQLSLPEWYGNNLDALYDCLTTMEEMELILVNWPAEGYLQCAAQAMYDAAEENEKINITII